MITHKDQLDEAFLATIHAWMRKSAQDEVQGESKRQLLIGKVWKLGMVPLLQRVLQLYAAQELQESNPEQTALFVNNLMTEEPSTWSSAVKAANAAGDG